MQTADARPAPVFAGTDEEQKIADDVFQVLRGMGRFFPRSAPIRVPLGSIAEYLAARHKERSRDEWAEEIRRILQENPNVFDIEDVNGESVVATTADGLAPHLLRSEDTEHTLASRLMEPVPQVARRRPPRETRGRPEPAVEKAGQPVVEPAMPAAADLVPEVEEPEAVEEVVVETAPVAPATVTDVDDLDDATLAEIITRQLRTDLTVANFGDLWMAEDKVPRLSRGDMRRIRDYILERNEPLSVDLLLQDVLGIRSGADNYDLMSFAVDFRLSREPREFEFVGTPDEHLWSTTGLPTIGTTKRKPSEIGQEYRFLIDETGPGLPEGETVVEHVLTFFEYQHGVLPLNQMFAGLLPPPVLPDQRAAMLHFEAPQTYENFLVELRYPTGNRGGYLAGFDRFYLENLVPGALFTIERTENDDRYLIEYLPVSGEDRRLLQFDEKKNRYVFRPMTFYCATQEDMMLTENRFPRFANAAPLDDRTRRRPELTLAATFERIGEQVGTPDQPRYMAMLDDLVAAGNIERPMSAELIRSIVSAPNQTLFSGDPDVEDVFYYQPATE